MEGISCRRYGKRMGSHFEHGLVDSPSEAAFRLALENVKEKLNNLERSCKIGESDPLFHAWFKEHKAEISFIVFFLT